MNRRSAAYPAGETRLHVPEPAWTETLAEIRRYGTHRSEALVFWSGAVCGSHLEVTGVYMLNHRPQGAHVAVSPQEARWLVSVLAERDEKLLAQVHSHPGQAYHSPGDDAHAASFHEGFYSIVVPRYGRGVDSVGQCGVYVRDGGFRRLDSAEVSRRIDLRALTVRRPDQSADATPRKDRRWSRPFRQFVSALRQRRTASAPH